MKQTPIQLCPAQVPAPFRSLLLDAAVLDSSCSATAQVYRIVKDDGYFLKTAPKGQLAKEATMTQYFHNKGLSAPVLAYESLEQDWLLTRQIPGEDCIASHYLADPQRLCDTIAALLRQLHDTDGSDCPVHRTEDYIAAARHCYVNQKYDTALFPDNWGFASAEEAWQEVETNGKHLRQDALIHGDYCLPNILLQDWGFSGLIDLGASGLGDRHIDLFWGIWSLQYNLKTDRYRDRFLDVYGRERVNEEIFPIISAFEVFG